MDQPAKILVNHLLSLVAAKGLLELWHVGNHVVDAVLGIGMRIGQNQSANQLRPVLITPSKRIRQEESLQIRKTVGTLIAETFALPGQSAFERQKSQMESAIIRGVLALCEAAILFHTRTRFWHFLRILVRNALSALVVCLGVRLRPPIAQVPLRIELPSLVVEPVDDFVPDDSANRSVIHGIV